MQISNGTFCPLVKGPCKQLECTFFIKLRGTNSNTGADVDEWDCAVKWLPVLLIENAKEARQTGAAIESHRNEAVHIAMTGKPQAETTRKFIAAYAAEGAKLIGNG